MIDMKHIFYNIIVVCILSVLYSCDADNVKQLDFDVKLRNPENEIYAGDNVTFDFIGDADYIVFFSGEEGSRYANRHEVEVDVESLNLSYTIVQKYADAQIKDLQVNDILVSTDFGGDYTRTGIENATWVKLSDTDGEFWQVPNGNMTIQSSGDLSEYKDMNFYLAFSYQVPAYQKRGNRPRVDIKPLVMDKVVDGSKISITNPKYDFGFQLILYDEYPGNFKVDDEMILFQPEPGIDEVTAWAISKQMSVGSLPVDRGTTIGSMTMPIKEYTYNYSLPGEYTVTFIARNANAWNTEEIVKEFVINVKEK